MVKFFNKFITSVTIKIKGMLYKPTLSMNCLNKLFASLRVISQKLGQSDIGKGMF